MAKKEGDEAAKAERLVEATYEAPYLAHACMEPMNCTAWVKPGSVEIWAGTQSQGPVQGILSQVAAVDAGSVKVNTMMLGGGFGRRFAPDFVIDATLLSKISGSPVKLIYSREDDMAAGFYRPASVANFTGGLDAAGKVTVLKVGVGTPSIMAASGFMKIPDKRRGQFCHGGHCRPPIRHGQPAHRVWSPGAGAQRVVLALGGPFAEHLLHGELSSTSWPQPQARTRSNSAAPCSTSSRATNRCWNWLRRRRAGAQPLPAGVFRGIAVAQSFGSYVAEVAEVSVNADGSPRVHRVVAAVDCGMTVNPTIIERQIEGAIVFGLSAALYGKITLKDGRVEQSNFHDYPVLRSNEMPKVEVHIVAQHRKTRGHRRAGHAAHRAGGRQRPVCCDRQTLAQPAIRRGAAKNRLKRTHRQTGLCCGPLPFSGSGPQCLDPWLSAG